MANSENSNYTNYTNIGDIKQYWLNKIAPNYFDFSDINNYSAGIFGYINELLSNATEDAFAAANIARREFYPVTAQYVSSLYKMATLQQISIPVTVPSQCKIALILNQDEVIENSTITNGVYECTIDSSLKIFADNLQFMLDYPIKIISKKNGKDWSHTVHYDISISNSLSTNNNARYISNKLMYENGSTYIILFIDNVRQLEMVEDSQILVRDSLLVTSTMDVDFDGNIANFEVFYKENGSSARVQLKKVLLNGITPTTPFVFYEFINNNKIRLTFKYNNIFVPKYNSEIITQIYTSQGSNGNFSSYLGDLICSSNSELYPYNSNMTILGKVNGSAYGGSDAPLLETLRNNIMKAYSTNSTITTSNDLQIRFDDVSTIQGVNVLFRKKRDDAFIRLFGAYILMKDDQSNILPTNTLRCEFLKSVITDPDGNKNRVMIKPGTILKYKNTTGTLSTIEAKSDFTPMSLLDIDPDDTNFLFTNPFLIGINLNPNIVGFYMNSMNETYSIDYTYVNDQSAMQFISSGYTMSRDAILGHNYYKISTKLMPASNLNPATIITLPDTQASDYAIRAEFNGKVIGSRYIHDDTLNRGYVETTIEYDTTDPDKKLLKIQSSSTLSLNGTSTPGYKLLINIGESFIANDIIATKMLADKGVLKIAGDISSSDGASQLYGNNYYIPFIIEDYDETLNSYTFTTYIETDDEIDTSGKITLVSGIFDKAGIENRNASISMKDFKFEMNVLYNNDGSNITNRYTLFNGLNNYTLTNTYLSANDDLMHFVEDMSFIRSTIDYSPGESESNYKIIIDEVPVVQATWALNRDHFNQFVSSYISTDQLLQSIYYDLENNFSIDSKLYNTYGRASFYTVGNSDENMIALDNVKVSFRFGAFLTNKYDIDNFTSLFRNYVREYIENTNRIGYTSQDIYILNMIAELKTKFPEISYLEYYGFNSYDHMAQKIVSPDSNTFIDNFIPEFVNLETKYDRSGIGYPAVEVKVFTV